MTRLVRLSLVQMACNASKSENIDVALRRVSEAADAGAQVICLPELFSGPYPCQSEDHRMFDLAEAVSGETITCFQKRAAQHNVVIVVPIFERRAAGLYHNTAVVIDADGSVAGTYRKMHIPDDPLYYEKFYFTPGDRGFCTIETRYARLGVGICWDQWFPEASRLFALGGAEILLYPTAIGWIEAEKKEFGKNQFDAWTTVIRSHAITNGIWVAAPNRIGIEDKLEFWGGSLVNSPQGEVIAQADSTTEQLVTVDCELEQIDLVRTHWPFLRDRRIDAYDGLCKRFLD